MADSLAQLASRLRDFAAARAWTQFHTPKNLAMAVAGEAGELVAELQWVPNREIGDLLAARPELRDRIGAEAADILIYLIRLADVTGLDLVSEAHKKIDANEVRYPRRR
jgi:dCTP diphosphatase